MTEINWDEISADDCVWGGEVWPEHDFHPQARGLSAGAAAPKSMRSASDHRQPEYR